MKRFAAWLLRNELAELRGMLGLLLTDNLAIFQRVNRIMATQAELAASLGNLKGTLDNIAVAVDKVSGETAGLILHVAALEAVINAGGNVSPELQAAFDAVNASATAVAVKVAAVDAMVPDAPTV